ncbi:UNVERIFIED_CONTAM: hypothetical protein RMT77_009700 [Armadillidium vulgare]
MNQYMLILLVVGVSCVTGGTYQKREESGKIESGRKNSAESEEDDGESYGSKYPDGEGSSGSKYPSGGESHGSNYPSGGESHGSDYPSGGGSYGSNDPSGGESHGSDYPSGGESHGSNLPAGGEDYPVGGESQGYPTSSDYEGQTPDEIRAESLPPLPGVPEEGKRRGEPTGY